MTQETLKQKIDEAQLSQEEQILEKIRSFPLVGTGYRGEPVSVERKDVNRFVAPNGRQLYCGPAQHVEDLLNERNQEFVKEPVGSIYFVETSKPNPSMVHDVTQVPTGFMYEVCNDGTESLYFDAVREGYAPAHGLSMGSIFKLQKITDNVGLAKVVEAINPESRLI